MNRCSTASSAEFVRPEIRETDLLTINYTSGTTSHPKGVMITHRNAWMNSIGTLVLQPMTCADRYLWTLPMFHANGWTFVWTITAAGATHVCLRKVEPRAVFELMATEQVTMLCAAPTVLISLANAPEDLRRLAPKGIRVLTGGAPPAASTIQRLEEELGWTITHDLRSDGNNTVHHHLRTASGTRAALDQRPMRRSKPAKGSS